MNPNHVRIPVIAWEALAPYVDAADVQYVMQAEVRLRVPNMKIRALDEKGYPIDHQLMRFRKIIEIPRFPHAGDALELTTRSGRMLRATVVRAEIDESRTLFVLSCQYAERSISADDYAALSNDPDWELKHLLE